MQCSTKGTLKLQNNKHDITSGSGSYLLLIKPSLTFILMMVLSNTSVVKCPLHALSNVILISKKYSYFLVCKVKGKKTPINHYKLVLIQEKKDTRNIHVVFENYVYSLLACQKDAKTNTCNYSDRSFHSCNFHHSSQSSTVRSAHKQLKQPNQKLVVVVSGYITASPKNMK